MKEKINKSIQNTLFCIEGILFLYIISVFIMKDHVYSFLQPMNIAFFMLLTFFSILFLGYKKNKKTRDKQHINNIIIIISALYLITIYLAANATGYSKNDFHIGNAIFIFLYMIESEVERYILLTKATKKNNHQYWITFLYILLDILVLSSWSPLNMQNFPELFVIITIGIIRNTLLSYITYKFGYYPCFIFSFVTFVLPKIAPIYPRLGNYLTILFFVVYTSILFYNISKPLRKEEEESINKYKKGPCFYLERLFFFFIIIVIFLVSGNFKYSISAIASDSMYPELQRGDAIILEKADDKNKEEIKEGTIIAFKENDEIITHRIILIEREGETEYFITKGDNNNTKDVTKKTKDDIIGIVKFKIPLVGYPAVEISEIKNKNKE